MDAAVQNTLLGIAGTIIIILLGMIAWFGKKQVDKYDAMGEKIIDSSMKIFQLESNQKIMADNCKIRHKNLDEHIHDLEKNVENIKKS